MNKHNQTAVKESTMRKPPVFCPKPRECDLLALGTKTKELFEHRWQEACEVIDALAEHLGLYDKGLCLYALGLDDHSPLIDKLEEWESRSGDKAKLKKRIDELENENAVLRKLLGRT